MKSGQSVDIGSAGRDWAGRQDGAYKVR